MTKRNYQDYLQSLLVGTPLPTTIGQIEDPTLETLELMLQEKDPLFARDVADELGSIFKWSPIYTAEKIVKLVRSRGEERGIKTISLIDVLRRIYSGDIEAVKRPDRDMRTKRFKNSQLIYADEKVLDDYIKDHTKTKLVVYIDEKN